MAALAQSGNGGAGWRAVVAEMLGGVRAAVLRFPVTTLFLLLATVLANLLVENIDLVDILAPAYADDVMPVIGIMSGALATLAAALAGEAHGRSAGTRALAALAAGLAAGALVAVPRPFLSLAWPLVPALIGLVLVAPFVGRGGSSSFWMFSARTAFAAFLGLLALVFLAGGISAILASLTYLFAVPVPEALYMHVWVAVGLFAAPLFALGQLPDRFDEEPGEAAHGFMDRGMRALGDFVAVPLLILYAVILHLYALRIVVTGTVPEGQIGWLVLTYGFCLFGALLVINPFFDRARAPTRLLLRFWPFLLPVPLVLLFYALALRVGAFGITPGRYLLGLFGIVTALAVLVQLVPRLRGDIRVIAALPVAALVLGSFGPQGALGLSLESQVSRFLQIARNPPVEGERRQEALGALRFLSNLDALARVAPEGAEIADDDAYDAVARAWGIDPDSPLVRLRGLTLNHGSNATAFATDGFDIVVQNVLLSSGAQKPVSVTLPSGRQIALALADDALTVTAGEQSVSFPIALEDLQALSQLGDDDLAELPLRVGGRHLKLLPDYLYADPDSTPSLTNLNTTVLMRTSDWR